MTELKTFLTVCFPLFLCSFAFAQEQTVRDTAAFDGYFVPSIKLDGEQVPHVQIPQVDIFPAYEKMNRKQRRAYRRYQRRQRRYKKLERNIIKVYPYSKIVKAIFVDVHKALDTIPGKKARKAYIKTREKELKTKFEGSLRKLTYSQGRLLIKLVDRETGHTTYEVVKQLKGSFNAFMWQGVARLFGSNLKSEYDSDGEDKMIEEIIARIESGHLPLRYPRRVPHSSGRRRTGK